MKEILTPEEKKYLRSVSNYLKSLGVNTGNIEFDVESGWDSVDWNEITQFSNRHGAEIPEGLIKILKKIIDYVVEDDLAGHDIHEDSSWIRGEIDIDGDRQEITASEYWTEYGTNDEITNTFEDEPKIFSELKELFEDGNIPEKLELTFNGGGDSGFIESNFNNTNIPVPARTENYCYTLLEQGFGGWEINEGSQGSFVFYMKDEITELNFSENIEIGRTNTLYEEKFSN
jgi:hypothetical protein